MNIIYEGMPFKEFVSLPPFSESLPLFFDLKGKEPSLFFGKTLEEVSKEILGWLPPHAIEGLNFVYEENKKHPVFHPFGIIGSFFFPHDNSKGTVFIFPGGGYYAVCALAEGYPFAERLFLEGYSTVVVGYRTYLEAAYPNALSDGAEAIRYAIRVYPEIEKSKKVFLGFSAGAHLAGVLSSKEEGYSKFDYPLPDGLILAYPVTSLVLPTHGDSRSFFLGNKKDDEVFRRKFSLENLVDSEFPKTFYWRCEDDPCVPKEGVEAFEKSLIKNGISYRKEILKGKGHGMALAEGTEEEGWLERALAFLNI